MITTPHSMTIPTVPGVIHVTPDGQAYFPAARRIEHPTLDWLHSLNVSLVAPLPPRNLH